MKGVKSMLAALLCAVMVLSLAGCGKSVPVKETEGLISAIGEVTADSKDAVEKAEAAYEALSEEDQKAVSNLNVLTAAREALDAAQLVALKEAIVGSWVFEGDMSEFMEAQINASMGEGMPPFSIDSFPVNITYTFRDDGTYEESQDSEVFKASIEKLMKALVNWMDDYLLKSLGDAFIQQGVSGDFSTWEGIERAAGMTKDEIYQQTLGMDLESFFGLILNNLSLDRLSESTQQGKYEVELGKLYMSDSLTKDVSKTDYTRLSINDRIMSWLGYVGNGEGSFAYPAIFNRVG